MVEAKDFFISFNKADRAWAEWIAWQLEAAGYKTIIQTWDFRPGTNFILKMHEAAIQATRTIAVLSPDYLQNAPYSEAEWAAAFSLDPQGKNATLLPVRVHECDPSGLLKAIIYIDLVPIHNEQEACSVLLAGIDSKRAKPTTPSPFPDNTLSIPPSIPSPDFPGQEQWPLKWTIPYQRNPFFTGRETLLQSLNDWLLNGSTMALTQAQAISGLGGIGKTQTALEYAFRYQHQYRYVLWVSAATLESLLSDLSKLADLLEVPNKDPYNQQNTANAVKNYLSKERDWLLIFDNADDIEMVSEYLPHGNKANGHIILTTRAQALGKVAHAVPVEEMDAEEGTYLLLKRGRILQTGQLPALVDAADLAVAKSIVEVMGGLPLALDQAAAYIEETGCSLSDYLKAYESYHLELLKRRGRFTTDYTKTVATTWSLAFQEVEKANKAAAELLRLCAFLSPDAIPEEVISEGASKLGKTLAPIAKDPLLLNDALEVLRKYSLLKRNAEKKTLSMHRLVQQVLKDGMNRKMQRQWAIRAVHAVNHVFPYGWDVENWQRCRRLLPQAQICEELIKHYGLAFADAARLLLYSGLYLRQNALYELAETFLRDALDIVNKLDDTQYPATYNVQHELAGLYQVQGKYEEAEKLYRQALETKERVLGLENLDTVATQHQLAGLYQDQGKYKEAEALSQEALGAKERVLGLKHLDTVASQNQLAGIYRDQGKYEEAETLYREVLVTKQRILGERHVSTAITQYALARVYQAQRKYREAETLYKRALQTQEGVRGREHPDVAATLHHLAGLYQEQGRYEEAETLYRKVLATQEKVLGKDHPRTIMSVKSYASLLRAMNRTAEAEALEGRVTSPLA